jgi:hypothetical protein
VLVLWAEWWYEVGGGNGGAGWIGDSIVLSVGGWQ